MLYVTFGDIKEGRMREYQDWVKKNRGPPHPGPPPPPSPPRLLPAPAEPVEPVSRVSEGGDRHRVLPDHLLRALPHRHLHELEDGPETVREAVPRELPLLPRVPSHRGHDVLREVPWPDLDPHGHPARLPVEVLLSRPQVAGVELDAHPFTELEEEPLGLDLHLLLAALLEDRDDHGLDGGPR